MDDVKERIARYLVHAHARHMDDAYQADVIRGDPVAAERAGRRFRRSAWLKRVALWLDRRNAAEQMAREGWWG